MRDFIINPNLNLSDGYILAVPKDKNTTIKFYYPKWNYLYKIALDSFLELKTQTCAVNFEGINFRASTGTPYELIRDGLKPTIYFRIPSKDLKKPEELGYPKMLLKKFTDIKTGLILFCGAQGSGKTTGMMSMLRQMKS